MSYKNRINFVIANSTIDNTYQQIPNYLRRSSLWLETIQEEDYSLSPVKAFRPAFSSLGGIYLEPQSTNAVTWNTDLDNPLWLKGKNVIVQSNAGLSPQKTITADKIVILGDPAQARSLQTISREFFLRPNTEYTVSAMFRLLEGTFSGNDTLSVTGGLQVGGSLNLTEFNAYLDKYRIGEFSFKTLGSEAPEVNFVDSIGQKMTWEIINIINKTVTLTAIDGFGITGVSLNELKGSRISIAGQGIFEIAGNTNLDGTVKTFEVEIPNLPVNTIVGDIATILPSDLQPVTLELYSEANVSFAWGFLQIEPLSIRSSPLLQRESVTTRSQITLTYLKSPLQGLQDFAVFWDIEFWRGIVNLGDSGSDFRVSLHQGGITVTLNGSDYLYSNDSLPQAFKLLIQVIDLTKQLKLYLNNQLVLSIDLTNLTIVDVNAQLSLTNESGVLSLLNLTVFDSSLQDGNTPILALANDEVREVFATGLQASEYQATSTIISLPAISIPAGENPPPATTGTTGTTTSTTAPATIAELPGKASIRLPFEPIDAQEINAVNFTSLDLPTASAYQPGRAFIQNSASEDIAEVQILTVGTNDVTIDSSSNVILAGHFLVQPKTETLISPQNYFVEFKDSIKNITIAEKTHNGIVIANYNLHPVSVSPYLIVYL